MVLLILNFYGCAYCVVACSDSERIVSFRFGWLRGLAVVGVSFRSTFVCGRFSMSDSDELFVMRLLA